MGASGPFAGLVVGARDPEALVSFLAGFGLEELARPELDDDEAAALYGQGCRVVPGPLLAAPGVPDGPTVRVLRTDTGGAAPTGWQCGPRALDVYTADLDRSTAAAVAAGWTVSPEALIEGGPMRMRQALITGPEGFPLVLVESTHRRSSVLDGEPDRLHSEPHSVVWCVADQAAEAERWRAAGWSVGAPVHFAEPTVSDELGLAERPTPITMTMISDDDVNALRLELLSFDDHLDAAPGSSSAGPAGLHALEVGVASIVDEVARWGDGARFGKVVTRADGRGAVSGTTGGGVRLVLIEA